MHTKSVCFYSGNLESIIGSKNMETFLEGVGNCPCQETLNVSSFFSFASLRDAPDIFITEINMRYNASLKKIS